MSYALDCEYLNKISYSLKKFKWRSTRLALWSCPICGEGNSKHKARCFGIAKNDSISIYCHNCNYSASFRNFLKDYDPELYREYILEVIKDTKKDVINNKPEKQKIINYGSKYGLLHVSELDSAHIARKYLRDRQIPQNDVYYTEKFLSWGSKNFPDKFHESVIDHARIIIPAYDTNRNITGYICRSLGNEQPKYYTLKITSDFLFGIHKIDTSLPVYIVEGPIDSLFIKNCVAACTSALHTVNVPNGKHTILIPDNDNRNLEIVKLVKKFIDLGHNVVIWPQLFKYKDINEAIIGGYSREKIMEIINNNTFSGPLAILQWSKWKKV